MLDELENVEKTENESNPNYRDNVTWSIVVRNNGPDVAHDVIVNDVLPGSLIWISDDSNGKYNPRTGIWTIAQLNRGVEIRLNIVAMVNGTSLPDQVNGNTILMAHSGDAYISFFAYLYKLELGNLAYITYQGNNYTS